MADGDETRPSAIEIYEQVIEDAHDELERTPSSLAFSGLFAGMTLGLSGLGVAAAIVTLGPTRQHHFVAALLYPLGFLAVILGRAQLFTENTLFPVIVVFDQRRHLLNMLRLWALVFAANVVGALLFAVLIVQTGAVSPALIAALGQLGARTVSGGFGHLFWAAVAGGWIIALMAWLVTASETSPVGQVALVYLTTFVVGAANLAHCIAGSGEALSALLAGQVSPAGYLRWLAAATLGNTAGGVLMVTMLNYGQVVGSRHGAQGKRAA